MFSGFFGKRLREENRKLREEVDALRRQRSGAKNTIVDLRDGIVMIGPGDTIEYINTPFAKALGIDRSAYQGKPLADFDSLLGRERTLEFLCREIQETGNEIVRPVTLKKPNTSESLSYIVKIRIVGEQTQILFEDHRLEESIEKLFKRYVPPSVVEHLKQKRLDPFSASLQELTVLFADLRGFSSSIESLPPHQVRLMINDFFSAMTAVVNRHQGTLDKFIGDGMMVLFGAPLEMADHTARAVRAATQMQRVHAELLGVWESLGFPTIPLGIGINTGKMVVGNIGSSSRMDYTALGHPVNLAARICDCAGGGEILVSEACKSSLDSGLKTGDLREPIVPGIKESVKVYPVLWDDHHPADPEARPALYDENK